MACSFKLTLREPVVRLQVLPPELPMVGCYTTRWDPTFVPCIIPAWKHAVREHLGVTPESPASCPGTRAQPQAGILSLPVVRARA